MNQQLATNQRYFGIVIAAVIFVFAWIAYEAIGSALISGILICAGIALALVYYLVPSSQLKLILAFDKVTFPIRWTLTLITLALVYYVVLTPIAIWYRASGKSIRKQNRDAMSNWRPVDMPSDSDSYFRTF